MRALITADWQTDWDNLHLCEQAWAEVLNYSQRRKMDAIVVAGDLKRVYNPIDGRVTNWWTSAISRAVARGIKVVLNLGNHDRVGQYTDAVNWFPVMRKAGAICVDKGPKVVEVGNGQLAMLPFCSNKTRLREWAKDLHQWVGRDAVLIFHEDLKECRYNKLGKTSEASIEARELHPHSYRFCVGGHIHLHQRIEPNIYYTGSPFCQDWGEANQRKGYTVITDNGLSFLPSSIPGWYDPDWPGFHAPEVWTGAKVRIHVRCRDGVDYLHRIEAARERAERKYQGAEIYICPDFEEDGKTETPTIRFDDPDADKIREYVRETCPGNLNGEKAAAYITKMVAGTSGQSLRTGLGVEFLWAKGKNFLGYKEVEMRFDNPGLFTVMAKNYDRGGISNGGGKTSLLQLIPVPLFGQTFKGQKHDKWARRNSVDRASVVLALRDSQNRIIKIRRKRRPSALELFVDREDQSAGMKPQDKDGTQGQIEKVTGFTWQTLANAVYIDQTVARAFLSGRQSDRTAVLSRFQNLERFEKALKVVRKRRTALNEAVEGQKRDLAVLQEKIDGYKRTLSLLVVESKERVGEAKQALESASALMYMVEQRLAPRINVLRLEMNALESKYNALITKLKVFEQRQTMLRGRISHNRQLADEREKASLLEECPTCKQHINKKELLRMAALLRETVTAIEDTLAKLVAEGKKVILESVVVDGERDALLVRSEKLERRVRDASLTVKHAENQYRYIRQREHDSIARSSIKDKLIKLGEKKLQMETEAGKTIRHDDMMAYCEKALSRDGIPAFLNALLCGPLNVAGEFYAETFCGKAVQVRFEMQNGEFVPQIINATGGESMRDQSDGEKALAGLIASFALREVAPKCNILILDEPGHGLDPIAAREFAVGLKTLKKKFKTIFVTTHNVHMLQEWGDEQTILVTRKGTA